VPCEVNPPFFLVCLACMRLISVRQAISSHHLTETCITNIVSLRLIKSSLLRSSTSLHILAMERTRQPASEKTNKQDNQDSTSDALAPVTMHQHNTRSRTRAAESPPATIGARSSASYPMQSTKPTTKKRSSRAATQPSLSGARSNLTSKQRPMPDNTAFRRQTK
jgi:hypothetical protein